MSIKKDFLSESNILYVATSMQLKPSVVRPIMTGYARDDVVSKAQGCLPVLNHMFI